MLEGLTSYGCATKYVPHFIVRQLKTSSEEFIFATLCSIVNGCTYQIFADSAKDFGYWNFFHGHASMIDFVEAAALNAQMELERFTVAVCFTVLDSVAHGSY